MDAALAREDLPSLVDVGVVELVVPRHVEDVVGTAPLLDGVAEQPGPSRGTEIARADSDVGARRERRHGVVEFEVEVGDDLDAHRRLLRGCGSSLRLRGTDSNRFRAESAGSRTPCAVCGVSSPARSSVGLNDVLALDGAGAVRGAGMRGGAKRALDQPCDKGLVYAGERRVDLDVTESSHTRICVQARADRHCRSRGANACSDAYPERRNRLAAMTVHRAEAVDAAGARSGTSAGLARHRSKAVTRRCGRGSIGMDA